MADQPDRHRAPGTEISIAGGQAGVRNILMVCTIPPGCKSLRGGRFEPDSSPAIRMADKVRIPFYGPINGAVQRGRV